MRPAPIHPFTDPAYRDRYLLRPAEPFGTIDEFVSRLVMRQPAWLTKLSMGLGGSTPRRAALGRAQDGTDDRIGNWAIVGRGPDHITFGEDMGIMRYRLRFDLHADATVTAATEVEQASRWTGPTYWRLATPLHQRFLQQLLRNAGGEGSTTAESPERAMCHPEVRRTG